MCSYRDMLIERHTNTQMPIQTYITITKLPSHIGGGISGRLSDSWPNTYRWYDSLIRAKTNTKQIFSMVQLKSTWWHRVFLYLTLDRCEHVDAELAEHVGETGIQPVSKLHYISYSLETTWWHPKFWIKSYTRDLMIASPAPNPLYHDADL